MHYSRTYQDESGNFTVAAVFELSVWAVFSPETGEVFLNETFPGSDPIEVLPKLLGSNKWVKFSLVESNRD
jgi:hypothetical protein